MSLYQQKEYETKLNEKHNGPFWWFVQADINQQQSTDLYIITAKVEGQRNQCNNWGNKLHCQIHYYVSGA